MLGQITRVWSEGDTLYVRAEWRGAVTTKFRDRAINMEDLLLSKAPAVFLACEFEMAMLDSKTEIPNVD